MYTNRGIQNYQELTFCKNLYIFIQYNWLLNVENELESIVPAGSGEFDTHLPPNTRIS